MNSTNKWLLTDEEKDRFIATLTPNLTILRTSAEISQEELANLIGVSRQTYSAKIIMRLPDYEDCKIAGLSMGLNDSQIREISRFPMGVAVVYQNNWVEAVLTQIDKSEEQYHQTDLITDD